MPAEVISLLSSSDAGSPPPQSGKQPSPQHASIPGSSGLGSLTPTFAAARRSNTEILRPKSPTCRPRISTAADDIWSFSDDEPNISGNVSPPRAPCLGVPAPKRRRLDSYGVDISSPDLGPPRATATVACSQPEPIQASGYGRLNPATAPISHTGFPSLNAKRPKSRTSWLDDDPFASSSPPQQEPKPAKTSDRAAIIDDINPFISSSPPRACRPANPVHAAAPWDPISSSAPLPAIADDKPPNPPRSFRKVQSEVITLDDSDDCGAQPDSDDDFPDITALATAKHRFPSLPKPLTLSPDAKQTRKPKPGGTKAKSAEPKKSALEKEQEKQEKAAAREAEKERKRLEKERAKQEKAQEITRAAALAEVNKIRTDKKVSAPEMIVDLPATLDNSVKLQAETLLRDLDVASSSWPSPVENVVKWRRKVRSRYNDELGHWEPVPERVDRENYAMVVIPAAQFVDLVLGEEHTNLESHVQRMKRHFPNDTIIYLIEGLTLWLRKNRNIRNRQFVSAVRSGLEPADDPQQPPPSTQQHNRKTTTTTNPQTYINEETIEAALLQLQVLHANILIHHTTIPLETARWIAVFTQHISTVPYRRQRDASNDAAFCMETGQVRTGDGPRDTYVRMLQEIGRVTAPIAYGIAGEFGTVQRLVRGLEEGGPLRLEKVRKSVDKEGGVGERAVGQAVSRRVCKIFLGRDEGSTDI